MVRVLRDARWVGKQYPSSQPVECGANVTHPAANARDTKAEVDLFESVFICWLIFGVCAAVVASNRGESGCLWFGFGVLLGPIGWALAFTQGKSCPQCGSKISLSAKICPSCRTGLSPPRVSTTERWCSNCGRWLDPGDLACRSCRHSTDDAVGSIAQQNRKKKCPFYAEEILAEAIKCRFCKEFMNVEVKP
jgi:Double zinc ribbon